MSVRRLTVLAALVPAAAGLAACGSGSPAEDEVARPDYRLVTPPAYRGAQPISVPTPTVQTTMRAADVKRLEPVLEGWSTAVREGRPRAATRYFALPAIVYQPGAGPVEVRDRTVAERFNQSFPCGTRLLGAKPDGRYVVGTFRLVPVPGRTCATPRATVKVGFVFGDRRRPNRFTEWWRVPDAPGAPTGPDRRPAAPIAGPDAFG